MRKFLLFLKSMVYYAYSNICAIKKEKVANDKVEYNVHLNGEKEEVRIIILLK